MTKKYQKKATPKKVKSKAKRKKGPKIGRPVEVEKPHDLTVRLPGKDYAWVLKRAKKEAVSAGTVVRALVASAISELR